jgi:hypothetical protein
MELLRKIKNLTMEYSIVKSEFIPHTFINKRNREYPYYKIITPLNPLILTPTTSSNL